MNVSSVLNRNDKWFLGGGGGAIYAPPFPKWLLTPGYWDETYYADIKLERLFCMIFLHKNSPIKLNSKVESWQPDRLIISHHSETFSIIETRCVTEYNALVSKLDLIRCKDDLDIAVWTLQPSANFQNFTPIICARDFEVVNESISWIQEITWPIDTASQRLGIDSHPQMGSGLQFTTGAIAVAIGADRHCSSRSIIFADASDLSPEYAISPLPELFVNGQLKSLFQQDGGNYVHILQQYKLTKSESLQVACCINENRSVAKAQLARTCSQDAITNSTLAWEEYFQKVPCFDCSDKYLTNAYWYRWYGIRLNTVKIASERFPHPCVFEGIAGFRSLISYSCPPMIRETSWMHSPEIARGIVQNVAVNQFDSGEIPGHIYSIRQHRDFYHCNWGDAILLHNQIHKDEDFLKIGYDFLRKYAIYLYKHRKQNNLITIHNHYETGQEYSSRYFIADENFDQDTDFTLCGTDSSYYGYRLAKCLTKICEELNLPDKQAYSQMASGIHKAMNDLLWDENNAIFRDIAAENNKHSQYDSAVAFYPFVDPSFADKLASIENHLLNPRRFWTPYPVATIPMDDPFFSAEGLWKGIRKNCPWNGRVWPMVNSHIVEALAESSTFIPHLKEQAGHLLIKWAQMMCFDQDPAKPNCFEHYNPITGQASTFRGVDDYMHSWLVDLIIRYVCGIDLTSPDYKGKQIECHLDWWGISGVPTPTGLIERES